MTPIPLPIAIPMNISRMPIRNRVILMSIFLMSMKITTATAMMAEPYMITADICLPPLNSIGSPHGVQTHFSMPFKNQVRKRS